MRKVKPILQRDISDCGVCSMAWIIMFYDGYIFLEKLREDTFTSDNGTSAYHIVEAFKKWGFDSYGVLVDSLSYSLNYPLIAHVNLENGLEHFVVVKYITDSFIYLMDPGRGNVKMSKLEFSKIFTGNVIIVYPKEEIVKMDKETSISKLFISILFKEKFLLIKIIVCNILFTIILIISSYYLKVSCNLLVSSKDYFKFAIYVFGILTFLKIFCLYIRDYYTNHLNNLIDIHIYPGFIKHLFFLPLKSIKSRKTGEVIARVNELASIKSLFTEIFITCSVDALMLFISMVILCIINIKLFIILFISISIYTFVGIISSKIIYRKILENINYQTNFNSYMIESVEAFESIKNLNITDNILNNIENKLSNLFYSNYNFNKVMNIINLIKDFVLEYGLFIINSVGLLLIINNKLNIVDLFTFNIIIAYVIDPVKNIINMLPKYNYVKASFSKISEFINFEEESINNNHINNIGNIEFKNVKYSYNNYDYVINNINFKINKGEHILIKGPSGCGKSTICKLLFKEKDISGGEILIDDKNIKDIDIGSIRNSMIYVSQNEEVFSDTIRNNILMNRSVSEEEFLEICNLCEIESIVSKKRLRYESLIDPSSKSMSGGEKQRIILARSLIKDASVIILDEALSETDYELERTIINNLKNYYKDKTLIYISHKDHSSIFNKIINIGELNEL